jgi:hypothetical protein
MRLTFEITSVFHTYDIVKYSHNDVFKVKWEVYDLNYKSSFRY